jgi:hypothetical protein
MYTCSTRISNPLDIWCTKINLRLNTYFYNGHLSWIYPTTRSNTFRRVPYQMLYHSLHTGVDHGLCRLPDLKFWFVEDVSGQNERFTIHHDHVRMLTALICLTIRFCPALPLYFQLELHVLWNWLLFILCGLIWFVSLM